MTKKKYRLKKGPLALVVILLLASLYFIYTNILPDYFIDQITLDEKLGSIMLENLDLGTPTEMKSAYVIQEFKTINAFSQERHYVLQLEKDGRFILKDQDKNVFYELSEVTQEELYDMKLDMMVYSDTHLPELLLNDEPIDYKGSWTIERLNGKRYESDRKNQELVLDFLVSEMNTTYTIDSVYPMTGEVQWFSEGLLVDTIPLTDTIILPEAEGNYTGHCHLNWHNSDIGFEGEGQLTFNVTVDYKTEASISQTEAVQGDLIKVTVENSNGLGLSIDQNLAAEVEFFENQDTYIAYLPITYRDDDGEYVVKVMENDMVVLEETITVSDRDFHIQHLVIDKTIASSTRNDAAYDEYNKYFPPSRATSTFEYKGSPFILPVGGRLSTEYGETRHVNGSPTSYRHSGLDIASPQGTPIVATNDGLVTLSMHLTLTGNTIVIDHGQGIFSTHFHLHERFVEKGDTVLSGEQIGTVGTTGFSTGPHLHFTMSYYSQNIEPGELIYGEPVTYDNYKKLFNP